MGIIHIVKSYIITDPFVYQNSNPSYTWSEIEPFFLYLKVKPTKELPVISSPSARRLKASSLMCFAFLFLLGFDTLSYT